MDSCTIRGRACAVVDIAARRERQESRRATAAEWAAAPVRFLPLAFLRATDGLFPGFSADDLRLLAALP